MEKRISSFDKRNIILFIIIIILSTILYCLYRYTSIFIVKNVAVVSSLGGDLDYVDESAISGISYLQSSPKYFSFNNHKTIEEVKALNTFVKEVFVVKDFPNSLYIYVTERIPLVTLEIDKKVCVLLDTEGFVLDRVENNCSDLTKRFKTIYLKSDNPKIEFIKGTTSTYFQMELITNILKVMNSYKLSIQNIQIKDNISIFTTNKNISYVFSFNQDLTPQLARFVSVLNELEKKTYKYKQIDLRFSRPVLTPK